MTEPVRADESPIGILVTASESRALVALSAVAPRLNPSQAARARMRRVLVTALRLAPEMPTPTPQPRLGAVGG